MARGDSWDLNAGFDEGLKQGTAFRDVANKTFSDQQKILDNAYRLDNLAMDTALKSSTLEGNIDATNALNEFKALDYGYQMDERGAKSDQNIAGYGYNTDAWNSKREDLNAAREAERSLFAAPETEVDQDGNTRNLTLAERSERAMQTAPSGRSRELLRQQWQKASASEAMGLASSAPERALQMLKSSGQMATQVDAVSMGTTDNAGNPQFRVNINGTAQTMTQRELTAMVRDFSGKANELSKLRDAQELAQRKMVLAKMQEDGALARSQLSAKSQMDRLKLTSEAQMRRAMLMSLMRPAGRAGGASALPGAAPQQRYDPINGSPLAQPGLDGADQGDVGGEQQLPDGVIAGNGNGLSSSVNQQFANPSSQNADAGGGQGTAMANDPLAQLQELEAAYRELQGARAVTPEIVMAYRAKKQALGDAYNAQGAARFNAALGQRQGAQSAQAAQQARMQQERIDRARRVFQ